MTDLGQQPLTLSRSQHCEIAQIDVESFKTLRRLGRIPNLGPNFKGQGRRFSVMETFALGLAREFVIEYEISWDRAATIASNVGVMRGHWTAIGERAQNLSSERRSIIFGQAVFADAPPKSVCGTLSDLDESASGTIGIDVCSFGLKFYQRAKRWHLDLSHFFARFPGPTPEAYVPLPRNARLAII